MQSASQIKSPRPHERNALGWEIGLSEWGKGLCPPRTFGYIHLVISLIQFLQVTFERSVVAFDGVTPQAPLHRY